jgi:hypothetical protein
MRPKPGPEAAAREVRCGRLSVRVRAAKEALDKRHTQYMAHLKRINDIAFERYWSDNEDAIAGMDGLVREMRGWRDVQFDPYHRNPAAPVRVKVELHSGADGMGKVLMRWRDPPPTEDGGEIVAYLITWERVSVFSFFSGVRQPNRVICCILCEHYNRV